MQWPWITLSFMNTGTGERFVTDHLITIVYIKRVRFKAIQAHDDLLSAYFLVIFFA